MVKEEHCDRNSLLSVDTDDVAAHGAQSAQDGPQRLNNQQKQKVVGKNLNLVLLTTLVCVDTRVASHHVNVGVKWGQELFLPPPVPGYAAGGGIRNTGYN